ncbi:MAG: hypothetical protein NVS1B7_8210 [Candidatus Saccharimonadales bacterium]
MLEFIVLGQIPGTAIQFSFINVLLLLASLVGIWRVAGIIRRHSKATSHLRTTYSGSDITSTTSQSAI